MATAVLLAGLLAGCTGISQEAYDAAKAQFDASQAKIAELQIEIESKIGELEEQNKAAKAQLETAQAQVAALQSQISGLKEQYELVGKTPAETAANVVKNYHDTHVYSEYDLFVCGDMASDVWNMLKAQGIESVIAIGNIDASIGDIVQSNHAWVLAEVSPGENLALETTAGRVVSKSENARYYRGWTFSSPAGLKSNNELVREYEVRVGIRNEINDKANEVLEEHNRATNQATADKLKAVYEKLVELRESQEAGLDDIKAELNSLATELR